MISIAPVGIKFVNTIDTGYGLSYNNPACTLYPQSGNDTNSMLVLEAVDANNNIYKIKLLSKGLYLTAMGQANGNSVDWTAGSSADDQSWKFVSIDTPKSLTMPVNINQKYQYNDTVIIDRGCAVCSATDIASYYKGTAYTLLQMRDTYGVYTTTSASCQWGNVPSSTFLAASAQQNANKYTIMKAQINANRPIVLRMTKNPGDHYVVVYGFTGSGTSESDFLVLDPAGSTNGATGEFRTLTLAYRWVEQGTPYYTFGSLILTARK